MWGEGALLVKRKDNEKQSSHNWIQLVIAHLNSALEHPITPTLIQDIVRKDEKKRKQSYSRYYLQIKVVDIQAVIRRASADRPPKPGLLPGSQQRPAPYRWLS